VVQAHLGALSPRIKRQERDTEHSPVPSAEDNTGGAVGTF
jgi:hypothetical protein